MGKLRVQNLSSKELREISLWSMTEEVTNEDVFCMFIARCAVDASGARMYRTSEVEAGTFEEWDPVIVRGVGAALVKFTGYMQERFSWSNVDEAKKNSSNGR